PYTTLFRSVRPGLVHEPGRPHRCPAPAASTAPGRCAGPVCTDPGALARRRPLRTLARRHPGRAGVRKLASDLSGSAHLASGNAGGAAGGVAVAEPCARSFTARATAVLARQPRRP